MVTDAATSTWNSRDEIAASDIAEAIRVGLFK